MRSGISACVWLIALVFAATISRPAAADDRQDCLKGSKNTAAATIAACTRAIESGDYNDRDLSNLHHQRGYAWSWTGFSDRVDRAFKDYSEAIRIYPKAVDSLLNRSHIYNQRHDYDRAVADANQAFEGGLSDYGKRVGYGERGYAYHAKGDNDRAVADYISIKLDANDKVALTSRGNAYFAKGDFDRATADYDRVIAIDPKYALAYLNRALAYRAKGDLDRVIADRSDAATQGRHMPTKTREFADFWISNSVHATEQYGTQGASQDVSELTARLRSGQGAGAFGSRSSDRDRRRCRLHRRPAQSGEQS